MITYELKKTEKVARRGQITTPHGIIQTPVFMPCGTGGSVKALTSAQVEASGSQIILCNTYHLYLRPGVEVLESYGGVHHFMNWNKPILTDSGGFQVFSLSNGLSKLSEEGVSFKSHIDGSSHLITPEKSIEIQHAIGSDIIMAFDQLSLDSASESETKEGVDRTIRWLDRCITAWKGQPDYAKQSLFGIVQGGYHKDLRILSTHVTLERGLEGIAIGGETIGYNKQGTKDILEWIIPEIPAGIPRYTMGVGDIDDIFSVVERGVDMFDCVSPTRLARNGALLISPEEGGNPGNKYRLNIDRSIYAKQDLPIDKTCTCETCRNYSRGYLHHLFRSKELLAYTLASIHNISMLAMVCQQIRDAIEKDEFTTLKKYWLSE